MDDISNFAASKEMRDAKSSRFACALNLNELHALDRMFTAQAPGWRIGASMATRTYRLLSGSMYALYKTGFKPCPLRSLRKRQQEIWHRLRVQGLL